MARKKFVDYLLQYSGHRFFPWVVFFLTICESVFLFIPPEVFMTPPIVANKKRAVPVVVAASLGSLVGGGIAYLVGYWLYNTVGVWLINTFASPQLFNQAIQMFGEYGVLLVISAAVTPIPYKVLCICAGFIYSGADPEMVQNIATNPVLFLGLSAIFRTGRFAIVGYLLWRFQEQANAIVKKYFWPLTLLAIIAAGLGIFLMAIL